MFEFENHRISLGTLVDFNFGPDLNGYANFRVLQVLEELSCSPEGVLSLNDVSNIILHPISDDTKILLENIQSKGFFFIVFLHAWMLACNHGGSHIRNFQRLIVEAEEQWQHINLQELRAKFLEPLHLMWSEIALFPKNQNRSI